MNAILDRFVGNISPVALLVSSFFWSWFDIVPFSPSLFTNAGVPFTISPLAVSLITSALVLAFFALPRGPRAQAIDARAFALCSLVCGTGGSVLIYVGALGSSVSLMLAGGVLIGVYEGMGAMVVGGVATCQGTTNALIHLAAALPLNIVAVLLAVFLQPAASVVFAAALPLLSSLCYAVFTVRGDNLATMRSTLLVNAPPLARAKEPRKREPFGKDSLFLLIVFVVACAFGLVNAQAMETVAEGSFFAYASLVIRAAASAVVFIGYLRFSWRPYSILGVSLLLMAVGLVVGGLVGSPLASWLFLAGYLCFDVLIWALVIVLNYRSGIPLLRTVCIVYAIDQLGIFVGTAASMSSLDARALSSFSIVLGCALLVLMVWFSNRKSPVRDSFSMYEIEFDARKAAPDGPAAPDETAPVPTLREGRLAELTARYFLSAREVEILSLLVSGRNGPYIAELLCVSDNTVKTHIRHIYTKLDVHNRQELLDLAFSSEA
ncbi:LuxR family transcriptional regulator [Arabiibacter massiliensis]|uniref:LuxR family transcriptional regulator n=1 Tax=Arabiibacter massiliensis TaxID=1870985 RepID=UPI0009BAA01F|nr:LuxR family transcriptional regulator [Arabiibacter massiliensis]